MPELPEVETIARALRASVVGKQVAEVRLSGLPLRRPVAADFAAGLKGRTITGIERRGKYLILEVEPHGYCIIHLGMSGRLLHCPPRSRRTRHTHAVIRFLDQTELHYRDHRRFGLLALYNAPHQDGIPELRRLGKDPLSAGFTIRWLWPLLREGRREVKSFLLDQRQIAGLGNIYACEALFLAGIHPARRCGRISRVRGARMVRAVRRVVRDAILHRGTTFSDFMDSDGQTGDHQSYLRVYHRQGKPCYRCGCTIRRLIQGNRSTFYCPHCQR